jgi:hypothetical protein
MDSIDCQDGCVFDATSLPVGMVEVYPGGGDGANTSKSTSAVLDASGLTTATPESADDSSLEDAVGSVDKLPRR